MSILSDRDILAHLEDGRLALEPFAESGLTPNGYDLRIAEVAVPSAHDAIISDGVAIVPPQSRFVVSTLERVRMPAEACGSLWIRSSYARRGVLASFGKVEAGFEGTLTLGAFNACHKSLEVPVGDRFAQLVFEPLASPTLKSYAERSGNYQGQSGITLARDRA